MAMGGPWNISLVKFIKFLHSTMYFPYIVHDTFLIMMPARTGLNSDEQIFPSFLPSFLPSFFYFFPSFLTSFLLPSFLSSFLPSFLPSFLSSFLPSFLPFFVINEYFYIRGEKKNIFKEQTWYYLGEKKHFFVRRGGIMVPSLSNWNLFNNMHKNTPFTF